MISIPKLDLNLKLTSHPSLQPEEAEVLTLLNQKKFEIDIPQIKPITYLKYRPIFKMTPYYLIYQEPANNCVSLT